MSLKRRRHEEHRCAAERTDEAQERTEHSVVIGVHLVKDAGHSLAEEQPERVNRVLLEFLQQAKREATP